MKKMAVAIGILSILASCDNADKKNISSAEQLEEQSQSVPQEKVKVDKDSKASAVISKAIEAHGGSLYDQAAYSFIFRKNTYTFKNDGLLYTYQVDSNNKGKHIKDVIKNGTFTRFIDDQPVDLSDKDVAKYTGALNSVIYFATLPHKLGDAAVNKSYQGTIEVKGETYEVVKVLFDEEGGGNDHDDIFYYWINAETNNIDFLAYSYSVNGGGVRFRSYYNRSVVEGITFQDYINWGAPVGTPLAILPTLFEEGRLKEFSKIETEQISSTK